jgi:putative copper export protein
MLLTSAMVELIDRTAEASVLAIHVLGGGVWIGAMVFSVFILQPRAARFFEREADFEDFIFTVVHGARWKVFAGVLAILLSGVALSVWPGHAILEEDPVWLTAYVVKLLAFVLAAGLFVYVSWILWPKRTFATAEELPAIKRHFFRVGAVMVIANALNMVLGIAAHVWR